MYDDPRRSIYKRVGISNSPELSWQTKSDSGTQSFPIRKLHTVMRQLANAEKLGYNNVEFREGDIDAMPVSNNVADVIVSNCVLNLVPNKQKVIGEIFRVLKPGGHFSISDIVLVGNLPDALKEDAEMYAGCVAGAIQKTEYLQFIEDAGFQNIQIQKENV